MPSARSSTLRSPGGTERAEVPGRGTELRLRALPSELGAAREYARAAAVAFGLDTERQHELVYAFNEAVTNAMRHGRPDNDGTICVEAVADGDRLTLSVSDRGDFVTPRVSPGDMAEHGRGLAIMEKLTDDLEVISEPGSTVVRLAVRHPLADDGDARG
jgi:anti-sigma regulatory factor (Ser/Thr protein kinase)